jgi:hypothetical protein
MRVILAYSLWWDAMPTQARHIVTFSFKLAIVRRDLNPHPAVPARAVLC